MDRTLEYRGQDPGYNWADTRGAKPHLPFTESKKLKFRIKSIESLQRPNRQICGQTGGQFYLEDI